jgi:hypothetical protein
LLVSESVIFLSDCLGANVENAVAALNEADWVCDFQMILPFRIGAIVK